MFMRFISKMIILSLGGMVLHRYLGVEGVLWLRMRRMGSMVSRCIWASSVGRSFAWSYWDNVGDFRYLGSIAHTGEYISTAALFR